MNIAIAGFGIEGKSNYQYFSRFGHQITILDEDTDVKNLPAGVPARIGKDAFEDLAAFDIVVRGGGVLPPKLKGARKIWSATNEFFAKCPAPIIGVTGTKGKGTTCSLIASILKQAGKTVHLIGNIGVPALDALPNVQPDDIVVYELSSFQLYDIEKSPHVAVLLMIEPDHLDIHATFEEYLAAKQNITRFQTTGDVLVYAHENTYVSAMATQSKATKIAIPGSETTHVADGFFWHADQKICSVDALKLPGRFNQDNACAAIAAAWQYTQDTEAVEAGLADFTGLPHRLKHVRTVDGVEYYDDSIATTVGSAVAAIQAFAQPKIIILGGSSKGVVDFTELAKAASSSNVKKALVIGDQAPKVIEALKACNVAYEDLGAQITMRQIVQKAHDLAQSGDVVLLSPACASFGMFKGYADRGDQFVDAVKHL